MVVLLFGLALGGSASAGSTALRMVPLVEHWNGSSWTQVTVAPGGPQLDELVAVVAPSATDVWAFGYTRYAQHWDGTAWQRVKLPVPKGAEGPEFRGAAAVSPDDIWAVGDAELAGSSYASHAIVDHWNGRRWSQVPTPPSGGYSGLVGVTALSADDVWAVGSVGVDTGKRITLRTLTIHWDGTAWTRLPSPSPATPYTPADSVDDSLAAVAGVSSQDVWAVGAYYFVAADGNHALHPLALHWDGSRWKQVPAPDPGGPTHRSFLSGVAAPSATGVWAVGTFGRNGAQHALAERWDGTRWRVLTAAGGSPRAGVSALSADDAWTVGGLDRGDVTHWNGTAWTVQTKLDHLYGLTAVAEVSPTDVWAVGVQFTYS